MLSWVASASDLAISSGDFSLPLNFAVSKNLRFMSSGLYSLLTDSGLLFINMKLSPNACLYVSIFLLTSLHVLTTIDGINERSRDILRSSDVIGDTQIINISVLYPSASSSSFFFNSGLLAPPVPSIIMSFMFLTIDIYFSPVKFLA